MAIILGKYAFSSLNMHICTFLSIHCKRWKTYIIISDWNNNEYERVIFCSSQYFIHSYQNKKKNVNVFRFIFNCSCRGRIRFPLLDLINDTVFISLAILLRLIGGIGQGFLAVSSYAMAAVRYKHNLQEKVGLLEAGNGIGFLVGPIVGGVIYQYTHFSVPFFTFGILLLILIFMLRNNLDEDLDTVPIHEEGDLKIGFRYLIKHKRILFAAIAQFFTLAVLTFGQPIFGERLKNDYGFSFAAIGLWFAIPTLAYALTGPLLLK